MVEQRRKGLARDETILKIMEKIRNFLEESILD